MADFIILSEVWKLSDFAQNKGVSGVHWGVGDGCEDAGL